jgi:hypothetical protein
MLVISKFIKHVSHSIGKGNNNHRTTFPILVDFNSIKKIGTPSCDDCIHFVPSITNFNHSKCKKFAKLNFLTKQVSLSYADINRQYSDLCGPSARYKEVPFTKK